MTGRVWLGLCVVLLAAVGLLGASRIEYEGGNTGMLAALSVLGLAGGALLAATRGGRVAVRVTGGLLLVAGIAVIITHHQLWYWLPHDWADPVSLAALLVAGLGLTVLLLAYGFSLAGLSGALGLLALISLALTVLPLPDFGSWERDVLRVVATALGAVALTAGLIAGLAAGARTPQTLRAWRVAPAVVAIAGAAATLSAAFDSYSIYATTGHRVALVTAASLGIAASLALGAGFAMRSTPGGRAPTPPSTPPPPRPDEHAVSIDAPVRTPGADDVVAATATDSLPDAPGSGATHVAVAESGRQRMQTVALVIGLVTGTITIVRELLAVAGAIVP